NRVKISTGMSAKKIGAIDSFPLSQSASAQTRLSLPANAVVVHKNGIEFRAESPIATWKEMTIALESPFTIRKIHCTGVVVACSGNCQGGYNISMLFTHISKQSEDLLTFLSSSRLN